jgi:HSP20 family molecular chaperone IbpA
MTAPKQALASKPLLATAPRFVDQPEADSLYRAIHDRIAERAYELYQQSGYAPGNDQQHWFQAESEVVRRTLTVRESGSWIAVNGDLPNASAEDVQIYVDQRCIVVRSAAPRPRQTEGPGFGRPIEAFLLADLKVDLEPSTATAALKDQKLSLMVKKRLPAEMRPIEFAHH